jgi:CheY-like chemotaxis protein
MKKVLIIEDEPNVRDQLKMFFEYKSWQVTTAENGLEGLQIIFNNPLGYDCIILDWVMPEMNGDSVIIELNNSGLALPPIIVLSAYADKAEIFNKCQELEIVYLLKKPIDQTSILEIIEQTIANKIDLLPEKLKSNKIVLFRSRAKKYGYTNVINKKGLDYQEVNPKEVEISRKSKEHETLIKNYFETVTRPKFKLKYKEPLFIVGRRWNSWYPSFFDVPGGAYAIIGQKNNQGLKNVAIIDPGFKFLSVTNALDLSVSEMESCIITHNHPDHLGGIFEFLSCRNVLNKTTTLFCNSSTKAMFNSWSNISLQIKPLNNNEQSIIDYKVNNNSSQLITVKSFATFHDEIGSIEDSCGLVIRSRKGTNNNIMNAPYNQLVIVGDTAYQTHDYMDKFIIPNIDLNTKIVVLHIGCSQIKQKPGKHLYLTGLSQILEDISVTLRRINYNNKLLVLVSEWGLEHAQKDQMNLICKEIAKDFYDNSLIMETYELFKDKHDKITILPADIGLIVGIDSGKIYLENNKIINPEEVKISVNEKGIIYS